MTRAEASALACVSIDRAVVAGELEYVGHHQRFRESAVLAWWERRKESKRRDPSAGALRVTESIAQREMAWLKKARENDDGTLTITGVASDASEPDCDNEVLDIERSWPFFERRMAEMRRSSGGKSVLALRVQHDSKRVAGHVTDMWRSGGVGGSRGGR